VKNALKPATVQKMATMARYLIMARSMVSFFSALQ
jgi:hypothetical protein